MNVPELRNQAATNHGLDPSSPGAIAYALGWMDAEQRIGYSKVLSANYTIPYSLGVTDWWKQEMDTPPVNSNPQPNL